ncbi:MAG TPA: hypothetical protein VMF89_32840, partial [Polyangiales bacterium]|nr:hypothetical protein [Polyangiales bacterium]
HYPIRVALMSRSDAHESSAVARSDGWRTVRFRPAVTCNVRQLVRLSRAAPSERLFLMLSALPRLTIIGLGHEKSENERPLLKLIAPEPGSLEMWIGRQRVLDYAQGRVMEPPENVLLAPGSVRLRLIDLAARAGLPEYIDSVAALVRHMADHAYGGILIIAPDGSAPPSDGGFLLEPGLSVGAVLARISHLDEFEEPTRSLLEDGLRAELARTLAEVGRLSALDGATIVDAELNVLGFGIILPVVEDVCVLEAADAAVSNSSRFPLWQYGARHRAAASYAWTHPGTLVFVASADGDIACMFREPSLAHVLMWRFRSGDITHE